MNRQNLALLSLAIFLGGCSASQRQNATTGEVETNSATKGALGGALAGVVIGLATGDDADERGRNALIGGASGAAIGGGIGYYFDKQEAALRQELLNSGVQVERVGEQELRLRLENGIGFESSSYELTGEIQNTLHGVARILAEYPETSLSVVGFTDSTGSDTSNQILSEKRADSVKNALATKGVASGRLSSRGYGERYPLCTNSTAEGRACNRRVEINIQPLQ